MATKTSLVSGNDASSSLIRHAGSLAYEGLPDELVQLTKQCILDTLGVTTGASGLAPEGRMAFEYVRDLGGAPESTILGFGSKAPSPWAAFVNGSLGHMLDYDDVEPGGGHHSIATVPVGFATAEKEGGIGGRDLIAAVAAGQDLMVRVALAITIPEWTMNEGWFPTNLLGYLGGAVVAGRLYGLDQGQLENALGIAFNQLSGSRQMAVAEATHMRSMQAGFTGQGAVMSADLARRGVTGPKQILEGRYGFYKTYVRCEPDWDKLTGGLGDRFPLLQGHAFKVWPACAVTRPTNAAILNLRREHGLTPDDVDELVVLGGNMHSELLSEPIELKRRPETSIDAKYSIPFTSAIAMANGNVTLSAFTEQGLHDPEVLAMADKVRYQPLPPEENHFVPAIEIHTRDGRRLFQRVETVPGAPGNPAGQDLLEAKFRDCVSFSASPVPPGNADRVIDMVNNLENVSDVGEIMRLLAQSTATP